MTMRRVRFGRLLLAAAFAATTLALNCLASTAQEDRATLPITVEEWSLWIGSPVQESINASRSARNPMPGLVGTARPIRDDSEGPARFPIAPVSIVQFLGEPTRDVDIELRIQSGSFLAHWPPARERVASLRWFGANLSSSLPENLPLPFLPESHPFRALRAEQDSLFLLAEESAERFIAYDAEFSSPIPLKLQGGPDEYTLQNLSKYPLRDVAVIAPTDDGYRVGWLDELPSAPPSDEPSADDSQPDPDADPPADASLDIFDDDDVEDDADTPQASSDSEPSDDPLPPLPPEADAATRSRIDPLLDRPVTLDVDGVPLNQVIDQIANQAGFRTELDVPALTRSRIELTRSTTLQVPGLPARDALAGLLGDVGLSYRITANGSVYITVADRLTEDDPRTRKIPEGPPVPLSLSEPILATDSAYSRRSQEELFQRLVNQGLRDDRARAVLDTFGDELFQPDGLIVLAHLSPEAIDDLAPLDVIPPPLRTVRVATLVIHGIDPRLEDHARSLVDRLGDPAPEARDSAEAQLLELGPIAIPALNDALTSKDVEVVYRAERLLLKLGQTIP